MEYAVVEREVWLKNRLDLLEKEKEFTRRRDELSAARREMPVVEIDPDYAFDTAGGRKNLLELFGEHSQLVIYHFMFGTDWQQGCKSCSFWADNFNGIEKHLAERDVSFLAVSRGPLEKLLAFRKRMGWSFDWVSSAPSRFSQDMQVSFDPGQFGEGQAIYNYRPAGFETDEMPGISVFVRGEEGDVYHSYSTFSRGLDLLNGAYNYLDLVPRGRGEAELDFTMSWLKLRDEY